MQDFARELAKRGCDVVVVAPDPDLDASSKMEEVVGVSVLWVRTLRFKDRPLWWRGFAEAMLPFFFVRGLRRHKVMDKKIHGVVWYSPTIFFGPLVSYVRRKTRCVSYLILRDLFPDWAVDAGVIRKGLPYFGLKCVERYQYRLADFIGVQTPANVPHVERQLPRFHGKVEVLSNWLSTQQPLQLPDDLIPEEFWRRKILVYAGNMGVAQRLDVFLDVAATLLDREDIGFLFIGRGGSMEMLRRQVAVQRLLKRSNLRCG